MTTTWKSAGTCALLLALVPAGAAAETGIPIAGTVIVRPDEPLAALNASGRPGPTQAEAAERLQWLVEKASGLVPPVLAAAAAPEGVPRLFVGWGPHLAGRIEPPEAPEGLKITRSGDDIFIIGEIAPADTNNWPGEVDRGVMHAVETFAERVLGYRFLFSVPDDPEMFALGTVVPEIAAIGLEPGALIEEAPDFAHRVPHGMPRGFMGLRSGGSLDFVCNHSHQPPAWRRMYGDEHPELFVLRSDGTRDWRHLDYAEPLVLEKDIRHLEAYFASGGRERPGMRRSHSDRYIMAEPTDNHPVSFSKAARGLIDYSGHPRGRQSNLWFSYVRGLSAAVKERWPRMRISTLAYQMHHHPPDFDIPDNVDIMLCLHRSSTQSSQPEIFSHNLEMVRQWSRHLGGDRARLLLWEYWIWPGQFIVPPTVAPRAMQRWLQTVHPYVSGVFINGGGHPLQFQYLMYRLWLRLLWDTGLDVDAEIADLCRHFYGPAGEEMTAFYRLLIDRYEMTWENPRRIGNNFATPDLYYGQSYPPEVLARLAALLEEARRRAGLPALITAEAEHGSAVYLYNPEEETAPVKINITPLENDLVDPAFGWHGGRVTWRGRLGPGETLEIHGPGQARLRAADGRAVEAGEALEGEPPELEPGGAEVISFWAAGAENERRFRLELRYGPDAPDPDGGKSIYARRLSWLRNPYHVFHPRQVSDTRFFPRRAWSGFFAEAHTAHRWLGRPPVHEAPETESLPETIGDPAWAKVPAVSLVRGCEERPSPLNNAGFPADLAAGARFLHGQDGLAVLLEAEGAPLAGEEIELQLGGRVFTFPAVPDRPPSGSILRWIMREFQSDEKSWRILAVFNRGQLGLPEGRSGPEPGIAMQIRRRRGEAGYIWSPPLGSPWGHYQQGPGELRLAPR